MTCHHLAYYPGCASCYLAGRRSMDSSELTPEQSAARVAAEMEGNRIWFQSHEEDAIAWWGKPRWRRAAFWRKPWYWRGHPRPPWA